MSEVIQKTVSPHDAFYKKLMKDIRVAKELLETYLPKPLLAQMDLNSIESVSSEFYGQTGRHFYADMVYKVKLSEGESYVVILAEHQSSPDPLMPLRILEYTVQLARKHLSKKNKTFPLIYPLVVYHNTDRYPYSTDLKDMVSAPDNMVSEYFLKPFHLIDLTQIPDEKIKNKLWSGTLLMALKHIFSKNSIDLVEVLKIVGQLYELGMEDSDTQQLAMIVVEYLWRNSSLEDNQLLEKAVEQLIEMDFQPLGGKMTSFAEYLEQRGYKVGKEEGVQEGIQTGIQTGIQEGIEKGFLKARQEIASGMLSKNKSIREIMDVTGLTEDEVRILSEDF